MHTRVDDTNLHSIAPCAGDKHCVVPPRTAQHRADREYKDGNSFPSFQSENSLGVWWNGKISIFLQFSYMANLLVSHVSLVSHARKPVLASLGCYSHDETLGWWWRWCVWWVAFLCVFSTPISCQPHQLLWIRKAIFHTFRAHRMQKQAHAQDIWCWRWWCRASKVCGKCSPAQRSYTLSNTGFETATPYKETHTWALGMRSRLPDSCKHVHSVIDLPLELPPLWDLCKDGWQKQ